MTKAIKKPLLETIQEASSRRPEVCEINEQSNDCSLTYLGKEIKTVEELLEAQNIDMTIWRVAWQRINNWEVTGKRSQGQTADKTWQPEKLWKTGNRQIEVKLERRAPQNIQNSIAEMLKNVKPIATAKPPKLAKKGLHMAEIGLYDHHFGKLCWGQETSTNYDLPIAEREFRSAIDEMLDRASKFSLEKIVMPLGNDFFHSNDFSSQTANLTRVESVDDRFQKVFRAGCNCAQYAVEQGLKLAPVEIVYVPGNHDRHTAWHMVEWLTAVFKNNEHVTIDSDLNDRKYLVYGPALLGYTHGDETKMADLPTLMATEEPGKWAQTQFRSWRIGHWHKKKEMRYTAGDSFNGVEIRLFPSLCGTDSWHYRKGYTGNARMAELHIWSKDTGPVGHFITHAKEPLVK